MQKIQVKSAKMRRPALKQRQLIGAIDQGTSSTRFLVFENLTGQLIASSQIEIQRIVPKEGWVEMDPNAIMDSVYSTIENVYEQLSANLLTGSPHRDSIKLECIGICNQRESTVVWDSKTGKALYNVIIWMDNRTKDLVDQMIDSVPGRDFNFLKDKTGLPMSTYFSAFKLKWLIDNVDEVKLALKEDRLLFGTVDSWILWNLTGKHLTDVTNASRTFLMDIETLEWDKTLCKHFNIPHKILPKILASADNFGHILKGPLEGLPITGVIGDQSAALFGHNCLQIGQTKATFGTGCFIMQNIGPGPLNGALSGVHRHAKRGLITTVGYKLGNKPACYALEGSIKIAGAALTWLRDNMQLIKNYEECDQLVNMTSHSAGVFFVPALGGLYSPYWDPNAAGLYIGLSQFSRREHLVRATFDSIAFQTNDILSLMRGVTNGLMIDGGLCKSDNMSQILADITGCDIVRPSMCETSALGAAMVAGCGAGIWSYESMLANSNTPYEYSSSQNQNHHYPHESLHYEDRFSSIIQSKNQRHSANRTSVRNLDAGGGINDDAGGGEEIEGVISGQVMTNSVDVCVTASSSSGAEDTTSSEAACNNELATLMPPVGQEFTSHQTPDHRTALSSFYPTPSSGYTSGDNFELTTTNSATSCTDPMRRDSPTSSIQQATEEASSAGAERAEMWMTAEHSNQLSSQINDNNNQVSPSIANTDEDDEDHNSSSSSHEMIEPKPNIMTKRNSYLSCTLPSNLTAYLHKFICQQTNNDEDEERLNLEEELSSSEFDDLYLMDVDECVDVDGKVLDCKRIQPLTKPVDVFQSYISLEHRTELVNTWRLAVERSMQWTKIHHEEIRRIDYQRLSSLPISMYLFFSIGMVALSGLLSVTTSGRNFLS